MKVVIQRVSNASVTIKNQVVTSIGKGYLVLLGVGAEDSFEDVDRIVQKLVNLRLFPDQNDKTNLSIKDINGSILVVSQFTLYADCKKGNRPSFTKAGDPNLAEALYEYFIDRCKMAIPTVEHGVFGAHMNVTLTNNGPFTIILE